MNEKLTSKQLSKKITDEYMEDPFHAHDNNKLFA